MVFVVGEEAFGFGVKGEAFAVGDVSGAEEWGEFAGRIEVGCSKGHRSIAMVDQLAGCRADGTDPCGDFIGVADGGGEQ